MDDPEKLKLRSEIDKIFPFNPLFNVSKFEQLMPIKQALHDYIRDRDFSDMTQEKQFRYRKIIFCGGDPRHGGYKIPERFHFYLSYPKINDSFYHYYNRLLEKLYEKIQSMMKKGVKIFREDGQYSDHRQTRQDENYNITYNYFSDFLKVIFNKELAELSTVRLSQRQSRIKMRPGSTFLKDGRWLGKGKIARKIKKYK